MEFHPRVPASKDETSGPSLIRAIAALLVEDVSELCARMAIINRGNLDGWTSQAVTGAKRDR